jgi:hypothetical protein
MKKNRDFFCRHALQPVFFTYFCRTKKLNYFGMKKINPEQFGKKLRLWSRNAAILAIIALAVFIYFRYYFVFGVGVKAGQLNYVVHKGYIFKTYEGKLIQAGFRGVSKGTAGNAIQSYEFEFSIDDKAVADSLMLSSGKDVELRYKEYLGALPWRGYSKFIVYEIVNISK